MSTLRKKKKHKTRQDKTRVGRGLNHKYTRRIIIKAEPFAELNINPTWLSYAGKYFLSAIYKKQYIYNDTSM